MKYFVSKAHAFYVYNMSVGLCLPSGCSKTDVSEMADYSK